jgi:hypothetical protein
VEAVNKKIADGLGHFLHSLCGDNRVRTAVSVARSSDYDQSDDIAGTMLGKSD